MVKLGQPVLKNNEQYQTIFDNTTDNTADNIDIAGN